MQEEKIINNYEDYYPSFQPRINNTERGGENSRERRGFDSFIKDMDQWRLQRENNKEKTKKALRDTEK